MSDSEDIHWFSLVAFFVIVMTARLAYHLIHYRKQQPASAPPTPSVPIHPPAVAENDTEADYQHIVRLRKDNPETTYQRTVRLCKDIYPDQRVKVVLEKSFLYESEVWIAVLRVDGKKEATSNSCGTENEALGHLAGSVHPVTPWGY